jgi:hypothetical protein
VITFVDPDGAHVYVKCKGQEVMFGTSEVGVTLEAE